MLFFPMVRYTLLFTGIIVSTLPTFLNSETISVSTDGDTTSSASSSASSSSLSSASATVVPINRIPYPPLIPIPRTYQFTTPNETVSLRDGSWSVTVARGSIPWPHVNKETLPANFTVLQNILSPEQIQYLLDTIKTSKIDFDEDYDSVDSMTTHEFYLESSGGYNPLTKIPGKPDSDPTIFQSRQSLREQLSSITKPIMNQYIIPFINQNIPACGSINDTYTVGNAKNGIGCSVCQSLIRRYIDGERLTHATHFDVQALVTVVIPLSRYGIDYEGGLYLTTGTENAGGSGEIYFGLRAGDAVIHQSDLLHGVKVFPPSSATVTVDTVDTSSSFPPTATPIPRKPERWSWIMWLKDGTDCDNPQYEEWAYRGATVDNNAVQQFLHARRITNSTEKIRWLRKSTENGLVRAANELAMELLHKDPALLVNKRNQSSIEEAESLLLRAARIGELDALYNLGVRSIAKGETNQAIHYFLEAAIHGHTDAAFNIGVAIYNGKNDIPKNLTLAAAWFERSNTGKGLYLVSRIMKDGTKEIKANQTKAMEYLLRSARTGYTEACFEYAIHTLETGATYIRKTKPSTKEEELTIQMKYEKLSFPWLRCAARGGNTQAEKFYKDFLIKLSRVEKSNEL